MYNLAKLYYPITARPDGAGEFTPCKALQPYIRCFWGTTGGPDGQTRELTAQPDTLPGPLTTREMIIPDTCMDIIWEWDAATGVAGGFFCGINDTPFEVEASGMPEPKVRFAIRFHFWAVHLFADDHLKDVLNFSGEVDQYFRSFRRELGDRLPETRTLGERIAAAEHYLLRRLDQARMSNNGLMNAIHTILHHKGVVSASGLENSTGLSSRQLERLFREYTGISPKKTADLVRFQNVWLNLCRPSPHLRNVQDLVYAYGYSHQSHLNNSFKRYAGRTPLEALAYSRQ
ncbi:helix-turn-helix domain-containing protein [Paenibacillus ihuae]|uniref:helix-turn-helix domain-containing protein n=1 Tax=Paenibacillus ihuae TaxID=1232431 RepID=UPI0006D594F4|nr:helix-turn-helix domain-containing protein [Paenibacillus ihuae]